jgi:hypothetical protein
MARKRKNPRKPMPKPSRPFKDKRGKTRLIKSWKELLSYLREGEE